jgi:hypothetical protein
MAAPSRRKIAQVRKPDQKLVARVWLTMSYEE